MEHSGAQAEKKRKQFFRHREMVAAEKRLIRQIRCAETEAESEALYAVLEQKRAERRRLFPSDSPAVPRRSVRPVYTPEYTAMTRQVNELNRLLREEPDPERKKELKRRLLEAERERSQSTTYVDRETGRVVKSPPA